MSIEVVGAIWKSQANGLVYTAGGESPCICVGAHSGVSPKVLQIEEMQEKSLLNRYVRYIYRKMKREHGIQETREEALRIFVLTTSERARIRSFDADSITTLNPDFIDAILSLARGWDIPTKFVNESLSVFATPEQLEQLLLDITPIRVRIRKLTPTECLRLMDMHDDDIEQMKATGLSNSALYKLAGNSIVCACLEGIFTQMFRADSDSLF